MAGQGTVASRRMETRYEFDSHSARCPGVAELRHAFHADVKNRIVAEIDKDLTKHPIWEIEKHLVG